MESQMQCNCISQDRSPRSEGKSRHPDRTNFIDETKKCDVNTSCTKSDPVFPKLKTPLNDCAPQRQTCSMSSLTKAPGEHQTYFHQSLSSGTRFAQSSKGSPQPSTYLTFLNEMFKPKKPTKLKNRLRKKTVEALEDLNQKIEEAKLRQDLLLQESRLLQDEILCLEAENCFVRVLRKQSKQCEKKHWELWNRYFQEREEISRKKQELTLRFAQQSAELQTQVWQGRSHQVQLRRQFQSMEHISSLKNNQKMKIQMLEKEIENMEVEMARQDRQAHLGFLQQRTHLVRQLEELKSLQAGGQGTPEVRRKARVLESTAKKVNSEFCVGVCRENQELQEDLLKLIQEYHQLECIKRKLEMWKQWLKEERWYREALVRGRRQLKAKRERSHACDL